MAQIAQFLCLKKFCLLDVVISLNFYNVFCSNEGYIPSNYVVEALNGLEKFE